MTCTCVARLLLQRSSNLQPPLSVETLGGGILAETVGRVLSDFASDMGDPSSAVVQQIGQLVAQLQREGILDEQFEQLMQLQDDSNPDFVSEVVQLYFEDSVSKIAKMGLMLSHSEPDFNELDQLVHQFKGSSASLGAQHIALLCVRVREGCQASDANTCRNLIWEVRSSFETLKDKLELFMQLEAQRKALLGQQQLR